MEEKRRIAEKKESSNSKAVTVHSGKNLENSDLEQEIYSWIVQQKNSALVVSTTSVVVKALYLKPDFKNRDP